MNIASPFDPKFWVEYEPTNNVVHLDTPYAREHARRNASYSAQLLEEDRRATRLAELDELLKTYQGERDRLTSLIFTLENEQELLRAPDVSR
jgi:hypothetical protein